jgi:hypothetical protein
MESLDAALTDQHAKLVAAADPMDWGAGTDSTHS